MAESQTEEQAQAPLNKYRIFLSNGMMVELMIPLEVHQVVRAVRDVGYLMEPQIYIPHDKIVSIVRVIEFGDGGSNVISITRGQGDGK